MAKRVANVAFLIADCGLCLLVIGSFEPFELPKEAAPYAVWIGIIGPVMVGVIASALESDVRRGQAKEAFMAFGAQRGLAPEMQYGIGGVVGASP